MSEECPICKEKENIYYRRACDFHCRSPNATEYFPLTYKRDSFACDNCGFFCSQEHVDKVSPLLDAKEKARIAYYEVLSEMSRQRVENPLDAGLGERYCNLQTITIGLRDRANGVKPK